MNDTTLSVIMSAAATTCEILLILRSLRMMAHSRSWTALVSGGIRLSQTKSMKCYPYSGSEWEIGTGVKSDEWLILIEFDA